MLKEAQNNTLLWQMLLIAVIGDFAVPYVLANFYKGYSHNMMVMSSLGNPSSPVRICYNVWLVILGVLLIISSFAVASKYWLISKTLSMAVIVLIVIFAVGAGVLSGFFSVNESKEIETAASRVHGIGASFGFMALLFVPMLLAILSYKDNDKTAGFICAASFCFAILFFILFVMADKPEFRNTIIVKVGLWQRLTLMFMYIPLAYIAVEKLIRLSARHIE